MLVKKEIKKILNKRRIFKRNISLVKKIKKITQNQKQTLSTYHKYNIEQVFSSKTKKYSLWSEAYINSSQVISEFYISEPFFYLEILPKLNKYNDLNIAYSDKNNYDKMFSSY